MSNYTFSVSDLTVSIGHLFGVYKTAPVHVNDFPVDYNLTNYVFLDILPGLKSGDSGVRSRRCTFLVDDRP